MLLLLALYPVIGDSPYWVHVIRSAFRDEAVSFYFYYASLFLAVLTLLAVPIGLSGATLPLIFHHLREEFGGLGTAAGRLYAWNTVGSLLGALVGGYVLLFWIDLDRVYAIALGAVVLATVLSAVRLLSLRRSLALVLIPIAAAVWLLPRWTPSRLTSGFFRVRAPNYATTLGPTAAFAMVANRGSVEFYTDDPASSVAVIDTPTSSGGSNLSIITNGKPDGSIVGDYTTMALTALLPALFKPDIERAFVIGWGTGVSVGELAALDSVDEVLVTEISPGVIEAASLFEPLNLGAFSNPKTRVIVSDAYRTLQSSEQLYDVIISEPSNPWVAGIEMLYSREFLEAARDHLTPDGVFAQWFHTYEADDEIVALVLRTYASVFDRVAVWYAMGPDLILLGFNDEAPRVSLDEFEARVMRPDFAAGLERARIGSLTELLAHEIAPEGVTHAADLQGDVHTLLHPLLSSRAARAFFIGGAGDVPRMSTHAAIDAGEQNSLMAALRARRGGALSEDDYVAWTEEICTVKARLCASVLSLWSFDHPDSVQRTEFLARERAERPHANELDPTLLADLAILRGASPLPDGRIPEADVQRFTRLYTDLHLPAAPFDRDVLQEIWRRCKDANNGVRCAELRRDAERRLGPLGSGRAKSAKTDAGS